MYIYIYCTGIINVYILLYRNDRTVTFLDNCLKRNWILVKNYIHLADRRHRVPNNIIIINVYIYIRDVCVYILWVLIIFKNVIQTPDVGGRYKTNFLAGPLDLHSQRPMRAITSGWRRETTDRRSV